MTLEEQLAYSAARLKPKAAPKEPAAQPEKRVEDMTLEEQLAYSASRLKKKPAPAENPVTIEETKEVPAARPDNSRFMDSFRSDDSMADFSRMQEDADTVAPLESGNPMKQ